jgi:hypothetical protein
MQNIIIVDGAKHRVVSGNEMYVLQYLPRGVFELQFSKEEGYYLTRIDDNFEIPRKLYGPVETISKRVMDAFEISEKNLGVLFSGPKGLGKTITVKFICNKALESDYPVILIKENLGNITSFIEEIKQPCVIVIDEFEKLYHKEDQYDAASQESILGMFDPIMESRKLFMLTCNNIHNMFDYLLDRPGRIHYHFRSRSLSIRDIRDYCEDNLSEKDDEMIKEICNYSIKVRDFSYDMLHSIIFEINNFGGALYDIVDILNLGNSDEVKYDWNVYFASGLIEHGQDVIDNNGKDFMINWLHRIGDNTFPSSVYVDMTKSRVEERPDGEMEIVLDKSYITYDRKQYDDEIVKFTFTKVDPTQKQTTNSHGSIITTRWAKMARGIKPE